jgi:DNA-binding response OmpR family regulator
VVDDDLHVGQAIRVWLEHHGFRVSTADGSANGPAARDNVTFDLTRAVAGRRRNAAKLE